MPPAWEGDSHFNANPVPFFHLPSALSLPSLWAAVGGVISSRSCPSAPIHSSVNCLVAPDWIPLKGWRGQTFQREDGEFLVCATQGIIPVRSTFCTTLKCGDSFYPEILTHRCIFFRCKIGHKKEFHFWNSWCFIATQVPSVLGVVVVNILGTYY